MSGLLDMWGCRGRTLIRDVPKRGEMDAHRAGAGMRFKDGNISSSRKEGVTCGEKKKGDSH